MSTAGLVAGAATQDRQADRIRGLDPPGDRRPRTAGLLAVLLSGQCLANIDTAIVNVATPAIHEDLGASGAQLQLVVSGYILAYAVLLITGARLGQLWGYRRMFVLGVGSFTLASLACGLAPEPITLVTARFFQGVGASLLVPQVLSGIQLNFSGDARTRALGLFVLALSGSAVIGQILGGALISADLLGTGWRPVFLINVPIGMILIAAALRSLPVDGQRDKGVHFDLVGVAVLTLALLLLLVPLSIGREAGWPAWTWLCLAASLPAFGVFVVVERRVANRGGSPLVNLPLVGRPEVGWALGSRAAATGTYFALLFVIALYLQQCLGMSPLYSGLALVSWVAAFGVGGPLWRRLPDVIRSRAATLGSFVMAVAYLGMAIGVADAHATGVWLIALLGVGGFGFGLATTALLAHLTSAVPDNSAADISGLYNTNSQVAAVIGIACFGTLYLTLAADGVREHAIQGFGIVSLAFAVTALFAAVAAYKASSVQPRSLA